MDKDRKKLNTNMSGKAGCSKCTRPESCKRLLSQRQQKLDKISSTRVIHMVQNFNENRSGEDIFFDCLSVGDSDLMPRDGNSCKSSSGKSSSAKATCPGKSETSVADDPAVIRATLERIVQDAQVMLKNVELHGGRKSCNATLEITARLITDAKDPNPNCRFQGRPVTMNMPLEFDPSTGQMGTKSNASARKVCKGPCSQNYSGRVKSQPCQPQIPTQQRQKPGYPTKLAALEAQTEELMWAGSCTETIDSSSRFDTLAVPLPVPGLQTKSYTPPSEPVLLPPPIVKEPSPIHSPLVLPTPSEPATSEPSPRLPSPAQPSETDSENVEEVEWKPEPLVMSRQQLQEPEVHSLEAKPSGSYTPVQAGRYYMALPQHKDFSNCSPCRYSPSPLMDEDGNIFCPGNCGCCQCAWKRRSFDTNQAHTNVKVCRCVQRGTIFTSFEDRETCSQSSYFDFCPCREKAEAKFLELYNCEMWSSPNATRGAEVQLDQIKELSVPPQPRSV